MKFIQQLKKDFQYIFHLFYQIKKSSKYSLFKILLFFINIYVNFHTIRDKIRIGIYTYSLKGGGTERATSLMVKYLSMESNFYIYVFTQRKKEENEYQIPDKIKRVYIEEKNSSNLLRIELKVKKINFKIYSHMNSIY